MDVLDVFVVLLFACASGVHRMVGCGLSLADAHVEVACYCGKLKLVVIFVAHGM